MRTRLKRSSSDPVSPTGSHRPVLLHEVLAALALREDDIVLDATLGGAGHAAQIAAALGANGLFIGLDADRAAIERVRARLAGAKTHVILSQANFRELEIVLGANGVAHLTRALFDLGWSSYQLDSGRGFSFQKDEPLLMTYDDEPGPHALTARKIVNEWEEESIADVLWGWGGERYARRIARAIVEARAEAPIETSRTLADLISKATPPAYRRGRTHPATKSFQALRIAVNDEIGALEEGLEAAWKRLSPGGRLAVITFHSVEDRAVKRLMQEWEKTKVGKRLNRTVIRPCSRELSENPRARSAKLRVIEKMQHSEIAT